MVTAPETPPLATPGTAAPHGSEPVPPRSERGFWCLMGLQFQGALNDNLFKQTLIMIILAMFANQPGPQQKWNGIIGLIACVPYLLFSCWAGFLADKFSKRTVTLATKLLEFVVVSLGMIALHIGSFPLGLFALFLLFTQAALFSPSKYGILPELVSAERISWANGVIGMLTYLAIIAGTAIGTELYAAFFPSGQLWMVGLVMVVLTVIGLGMGLGIDHTPAANPSRPFRINFIPEALRYFRIISADRMILLTVAGLSYFWGLGSVLLAHITVWGNNALGLGEVGSGRLYTLLAIGIGMGAFLAGKLSGKRIELGLVPIGGIGLALATMALALGRPGLLVPMLVAVAAVGIFAGFYSLPFNALLQARTDIHDRGGILAANSFCNFVAILVFQSLYAAAGLLHPSPNTVFFVVGLLTLVAVVVLLRVLPEALLRFVGFLFTRVVYRVRARGMQHIPQTGPALLVANHVSFIDALLIGALTPRPVRFLAWEGLFQRPILRWFLKSTRTIPVGSGQRPRDLINSLRTAGEALKNGELVCIFAEGQITRTGRLLPLRRGYEYILKECPAPVIPIGFDGVWGSIFSFESGKFFWKWPRRLPYPVRAVVGEPLPPTTEPTVLRQHLLELTSAAALDSKADTPPLHVGMIRASRRHWKQFAALDIYSETLTHGQLLWRSMVLARRLRAAWGDQQTVGALLPSSVGGALINYAAALSGRTVVNLNYTTGQAVLDACAAQCPMHTTATARPFLEKVGLTPPGTPIYVEEYRGFRSVWEIIGAIALARFGTVAMIERFCGMVRRPTPDTLATIIFSSGSTGTPKGVMLSHFNIASNIQSFRTGIHIWPHDRMLGTLPFFHSFGFTVALWGSALGGYGIVYHANPLDLKTVGELMEKHKVTIIITTPTFLGQYMRRLTPEQLGGVNCIITGAERLPDSLREAFRDKFGIEPLQGYGTTECAPVVSTNIDDFRAAGFRQVGHKRGSIGHPLPGIAVQVRGAETGEPLPVGESGLIWVKGPNIMQGYLGMPEKTAEVLQNGWYNTGDMGFVDEDGFTFITGRLSRFSKIGGEMVPHGAIEEKLNDLLGLAEPALVVAAVPDEAKGERLVVLHTLAEDKLSGINEKLAAAGLPNLWIPRRQDYYKIDAIPVLGTGKLDLQGVNRLAKEIAGKA